MYTLIMPRYNFEYYDQFKGLKYNRLTIIEATSGRSESGSVLYKYKCDCGNIILVRKYELVGGNTTSCGCKARENQKNFGNLVKGKIGIASFRNLFRSYRAKAKKRKIEFNLTFDQFINIIKNQCIYCDKGLHKYNVYLTKSGELSAKLYKSLTQKFRSMTEESIKDAEILVTGIDRVNSNIGYQIDNCVPCCFICNRAKSEMSYFDWIEYLSRFNVEIELKLKHKLTTFLGEIK